jgi:hypothetical protein
MMATVTDIAHFALAQLTEWSLRHSTYLERSYGKRDASPTVYPPSSMIGSGYGFYEDLIDNKLVVLHNGRQNGYTSKLALLPDQNLGLIVTCNNNPTPLNDDLLKAFLDRYYPVNKKPIPPSQGHPSSQEFIQKLGGTYRYNRYPHHTLEKLAAVFGEAPEVQVITGKDSTFSIYIPENKAVEVEPLFFRTLYSDTSITFRQDERGRITYMFLGDSAFGALEKLAWYETKDFQVKLVVFCTLVFFSCLCSGVDGLANSSYPQAVVQNFKNGSTGTILAVLVSALNLIFLIGLGLVVLNTDFWEFFFGVPPAAIACFSFHR